MKTSILGFTFGVLAVGFVGSVQARDDGRYSQSPLKPWFDSLKSGKGPCCSDADGFAVSDPDWESRMATTLSASITNGSTFLMMR
jgi:hypothetical protein